MERVRVYALFGDYGRNAGRRSISRLFDIYYSPYLLESYFSFPAMESGRIVVDKTRLKSLIQEINGSNCDAVYSCDAVEALLLQYVMRKQGVPEKPFLINDPDLLQKARRLGELLHAYYGDHSFQDFLFSPRNHWFVTALRRMETYQQLGIPKDRLHYIPVSTAAIRMFFPSLASWIDVYSRQTEIGERVLSSGSHDRDYELLVEAVRPLEVKVDIVTNLHAYRAREAANVRWYHSLEESEYVKKFALSRYVVLPLKRGESVAGQMNSAIGMRLGKLVVATECEGLAEYCLPGETGFSYGRGDKESLRRAIELAEAELPSGAMAERGKQLEENLSAVSEQGIERLAEALRG